jgi:hypothetical protein
MPAHFGVLAISVTLHVLDMHVPPRGPRAGGGRRPPIPPACQLLLGPAGRAAGGANGHAHLGQQAA